MGVEVRGGSRPPRLRACIIVMLLSMCTTAVLARAATLDEYQVKAVFLFNFTQFVEWPRTAFTGPDAPFVIGVLGADPFGRHLDDVVQGERVDGHPIVVRRLDRIDDAAGVHILYVDRSAGIQLAPGAVGRLDAQSTLTVSDAETQAARDVVIRFLNANNRIRLRINVTSAQSAGLVLSSKLLRPAEIVGRENGR
jgi:hypothetical protein